MRVGIELLQLVPGESGGIVPLWKGVLRELFALAPESQFIVYGTSRGRPLLAEVPDNVRWHEISAGNLMRELDFRLDRDRVDLLLRCYPLELQLFFPAGRQIVMIPDVQHEAFPQFFDPETLARRRAAFGLAARNSGAVGVISEATRAALVSIYPETEGKIFLMPPALTRSSEESDEPLTEEELAQIPQQPYFFFPANLWPHKNHRGLISALQRFNQTSRQQHALVLTGHPGGWEDLKEAVGEEPVFHLGFVRRPLLHELFRRARALTYFSLYEGFGMPLLEAFEAGVPVLCSNTSSLPEVGGDAVLTCDPTDADAMADLMHQIAQNESLRQSLIGKGKQRLGLYSWEASAENLLAATVKLHESFAVQHGISTHRISRAARIWWTHFTGKKKQQIRAHYRKLQELQQQPAGVVES